MGYINPLLDMPEMQDLINNSSPGEKERLERLFRAIRFKANIEAETSWLRRKAPMATYWRAVSTYARHIAHAFTR